MKIVIDIPEHDRKVKSANDFEQNDVFTDGKQKYISTSNNCGWIRFIQINDDGSLTVPDFNIVFDNGQIYWKIGTVSFTVKS